MLKKLISLSLALVMLLAMATVPASAVVTKTLIDDFETGNVGSVSTTAGDGYYVSSSESGLFIDPTKAVSSNGLSISQTAGYDGSAGLVMEVGAAGGVAHVTAQAIPLTYDSTGATTNDLTISYKIKFLSLPTVGTSTAVKDAWLLLSHEYESSGYYSYGYTSVCAAQNNVLMSKSGATTTTDTIETNKWFTVVSNIYSKSASSRTLTTTILDEDGNTVVSYSRAGSLSGSVYFTPVYIDGSKFTSGTAKLVLDDVKITNYTEATQNPSFDASATELKEGATGVNSTKPLMISFDQAVKADEETVKVYRSDDESETGVSADVSTVFNKVIIKPESNLEKGVEYVIDFSGVLNEASLALDSTSAKTLTFTTSSLTPPPAVLLSSIENGATGIEVTAKSATVTFDQALDLENSVAKLTYGTDGEIAATIAATETENVYTISWLDDLVGLTTYTLDLSGVRNVENPEGAGEKANIVFTTKAENPDLLTCVPLNGEKSASISLNEILLTYDQVITEYPETVTIKGGTADIIATVSTEDNKTMKLLFTEALEGNTTYTIDLSGFGNAKGASYTTEYSFKTEYASIVKLTDGFDDANQIKVGSTSTSYGSTGSVLSMGASAASTDVTVSDTLTLENVSEEDTALALTTGSGNATYIKTLRTTTAHSITEEEALIATWRFNLKEQGTYNPNESKMGTKIGIGISGSESLGFSTTLTYIYTYADDNGAPSMYYTGSNESTRRAIKEDNWYNAIMKVDAFTKTIDIVDGDETSDTFGQVIYSKTVTNTTGLPWGGEDSPFYFHIAGGSRQGNTADGIYNENQKLLLNDFTLWRVKKTAPQMALAVENVDNTNIDPDGTMLVTFNQPVFPSDPVVDVYTGENGDENAYSFTESSIVDFCKYKIGFSGLNYLEDYKVDLSKTSAISGAPFDAENPSIDFSTTADTENDVSILNGIETSGVYTGDTISANLYSAEDKTVKVVAALYDRHPAKLAKAFVQDVELSAGIKKPVTFTLDVDYPEAGVVKLFVWDKDVKTAPLAKAEARVTADDNLKILLWGNSLSEDAQRYLNKIAEASGVTLDILMKGRGGTALTQHAENLRYEIENGEVNLGYFTYENGTFITATDETRSLVTALTSDEYDYVSVQQVASGIGYEEETKDDMGEALIYMVSNIRKFQPTAEILFYESWATRDTLASKRNSVYKDSIKPCYDYWVDMVQDQTTGLTVNDKLLRIIPTGEAFYYADNRLPWAQTMWTDGDSGNTNAEAKDEITTKMLASAGIWRDYNHASWYGCYLCDAVWLGTLTGIKAAIVDSDGEPLVPAPTGVSAEEHLQRLSDLSDIAYAVVLKNR